MSKNIKYINSKVKNFQDNRLYFENGSVLIIVANFKINGDIKNLNLLDCEISEQKVRFLFENEKYIELFVPYLTDELFCVINRERKYRCLLTKDNLLGEWIGLNE